MFVVEMDSSGNFLELFSHSNLFRRIKIYLRPLCKKTERYFSIGRIEFRRLSSSSSARVEENFALTLW